MTARLVFTDEPPPPPVTYTRSDVADMVRAHVQLAQKVAVMHGVPPEEAAALVAKIAGEEA